MDEKVIVLLKCMQLNSIYYYQQLTFICKMKANRPSFPSVTTVTDVEEDKTNEQNIYRKLGSWSLEEWQIYRDKWSMPISTTSVTAVRSRSHIEGDDIIGKQSINKKNTTIKHN